MIGTMYGNHSLPRAYGGSYGSYGRQKSGGGGVLPTVAIVVLMLGCVGLGFTLVSSRAQLKDMTQQYDTVQDELTYTKNHLHHIEAQLAGREIDYHQVSSELHQYTSQRHSSAHEMESLRQKAHEAEALQTKVRQLEMADAIAQEQATKLKHDLETTNALVEAYKQHLSDEVASHHQREENWLHIQEDWERLEKEMEAEINMLKNQLNEAKIKIAENMVKEHQLPQHVAPEAAHPHDPIWDSLPPPNQQQQQQMVKTPAQLHHEAAQRVQAILNSPQATATVTHANPAVQQQQQVPVPVPQPVPAPVPQPVQVPVPQQQQQQPVHVEHAAPVPVHEIHQQQQQHNQVGQPAPTTTEHPPPQPVEAHHDDHHEWQPEWQHTDYDKYFDHHNLYADYPGWVDEPQQADQHQGHGAVPDAQHHEQHQQHHDQHQDQHQQHQDAHGQQAQGGDWHHQDDSHHFQHQEAHHAAPARR